MSRSPRHERVPPQLSRRKVLQIGGIGAMGLTLPALLRAEATSANKRERRAHSTAKSCIFIHQYGGLSQLDSWDMKPDAPSELRGPYRSIETATPGYKICELMPRLARLSGRYAVIRSMTHKMSRHDKANSMLLAGREEPAEDDPSFGAMVTKLRPSTAAVPPHIWLQKFGGGAKPPDHTYLTGGTLGAAYAPMLIGEKHDDNPASANFRVRAFDTNKQMTLRRLEERWNLARSLQQGSTIGTRGDFESFELYQRQAFRLLHSTEAKAAFDVSQEKARVWDRYGRNPLGQNLLLARRLIQAGVRLVSVVAWTGLARAKNSSAWKPGICTGTRTSAYSKTVGTVCRSRCRAPIRRWQPCWKTCTNVAC